VRGPGHRYQHNSDDRRYTAVYKPQTPDILDAFNHFDRAAAALRAGASFARGRLAFELTDHVH
jgi:hypothetical protein